MSEDNSNKKAASNLMEAAKLATQLAKQDYLGASITAAKNIKVVLFILVAPILVICLLISMLPSFILGVDDASINSDTLDTVYIETSDKTKEIINEYYQVIVDKAIKKGENYVSTHYGEGDTTGIIIKTDPTADTKVFSQVLGNKYMATYGICHQYDQESNYEEMTNKTYDSTEIQKIYGNNFYDKVRQQAQTMFFVGDVAENVTYTQRTEKVPLIDKNTGKQQIDSNGNLMFITKIIKVYTGEVIVHIRQEDTIFMSEEIQNSAEKITDLDTTTEKVKQINDEIDTMYDMLNELSGINNAKVLSSNSSIIKNFLKNHPEIYNQWKNVYVGQFSPPFSYSKMSGGGGFGGRYIDGYGYNFHTGIDFSWGGCHNAKIPASLKGVVVYAYGDCLVNGEPSLGYGNCVIIYHGKLDGRDMFTVYGHMEKVYVHVGQVVEAGDTIATIGTRGFSTGYHLHWEINFYNNGKVTAEDPKKYTK